MIINEDILLDRVMQRCQKHDLTEDIEIICNALLEEMYQCLREGNSIQYGDYPFMKAKKTVDKVNSESPRTRRNDRVMVSIKIPLDTKNGI